VDFLDNDGRGGVEIVEFDGCILDFEKASSVDFAGGDGVVEGIVVSGFFGACGGGFLGGFEGVVSGFFVGVDSELFDFGFGFGGGCLGFVNESGGKDDWAGWSFHCYDDDYLWRCA